MFFNQMNRRARRTAMKDDAKMETFRMSEAIARDFVQRVSGLEELTEEKYYECFNEFDATWKSAFKNTFMSPHFFGGLFRIDFKKVREQEEYEKMTTEEIVDVLFDNYKIMSEMKQKPYVKPKGAKKQRIVADV